MFESASVDILHLFVFVIPGFLTVWSFRYVINSEKKSDFEYLALSVIWGLIMLLFFEVTHSKESIEMLVQNPYATAMILGIFGLLFGWVGGLITKSHWFRNLVNFFKNN